MRLINTITHDFKVFIGTDIPKYVILSHTWGEAEISFEKMRHLDKNTLAKNSVGGLGKLNMTCQIAQKAGINYAWVDTWCIDQSNNVELTEAINSMYNWYRRSEICLAYLSDLEASAPLETALKHCRWFTRGWTLQELIAPNTVLFYDQDWNLRGSKVDLVSELSYITKISKEIIQHPERLSTMSVAQRMSWAAGRKTTRIEDAAYCLLGIFGVHMPLLYGEESRAFRRLQEEIMKIGSDFSILAWRRPRLGSQVEDRQIREYCGVLAPSPCVFSDCCFFSKRRTHIRHEIHASNGAITTKMLLIELDVETGGHRYVLPLDCSEVPNTMLGVRLRKCGPNEFVRVNPSEVENFDQRKLLLSNVEKRNLLVDIENAGFSDTELHNFVGQRRSHAIQIKLPKEMWQHPFGIRPGHRYDAEDQVFFIADDSEYDSGMLRLKGSLESPVGGLRPKAGFECVFGAFGWSSTEVDSLQCTLLDRKSWAKALDEFESDVSGWDYQCEQCLQGLIQHNIPKTSAVCIQIPETSTWACVSFTTPYLVDDESVCRNSFWRIEISCSFYHDIGDLPRTECDTWNLKHASLLS